MSRQTRRLPGCAGSAAQHRPCSAAGAPRSPAPSAALAPESWNRHGAVPGRAMEGPGQEPHADNPEVEREVRVPRGMQGRRAGCGAGVVLVQGDPLFPCLCTAKFSLKAEFQHFFICPWSLFGAMMRRCVAAASCYLFLLAISFSLSILWGV